MLSYADITARVQTALNIYQKRLNVYTECICAEVDKQTTLGWNATFLSIYNLLESAFSKQIVVQFHTDSKGRNIVETRCLCMYVHISCKASLSLPRFLVPSAWQHIKMKSTMQETLVMINDHNRNLCTLNKQHDLCVLYKPILWLYNNASTNTVESSLPKRKTSKLTVLQRSKQKPCKNICFWVCSNVGVSLFKYETKA